MPFTVLIVDDHPRFRSVAGRVLEAGGFQVVGEADDGEGALEAVAALRPQIVLLDVQLPGLDGIEVARLIASQPTPPVVVLVSNREAADYGARVSSCGAQGFLAKRDLTERSLRTLLGAAFD